MGRITVYGVLHSPPVRSVLLTAKLLNLPHEFSKIDIMAGESRTPEFLELNPLHTVPVIDDNGFILFESHAVMIYFLAKYGTGDTAHLYPNDIQQRAIVNQRLFYNSSTTFNQLRDAAFMWIYEKAISEGVRNKTAEVFRELEILLGDHEWIAHTTNYTIADMNSIATVESIEPFMPGVLDDHPKLRDWIQRGKDSIPYFKEQSDFGLKRLRQVFGLIEQD